MGLLLVSTSPSAGGSSWKEVGYTEGNVQT